MSIGTESNCRTRLVTYRTTEKERFKLRMWSETLTLTQLTERGVMPRRSFDVG